MIIKMLESRKGTEDGFSIQQFFKDEIYAVRENLGRTFNANGWATTKIPEDELYHFQQEQQTG